MITGISIENFKGISERVTLDLRPITLLFGANSAGKSTVMHAMLYFYEVFVNHNLDADRTEVGGTAIHLGGFRNLQANHDREKPIVLRIDCTCQYDFEHESEFEHSELLSPAFDLLGINVDTIIETQRPDHIGMELTIAWNERSGRPFVERTKLFFEQEWFAVIESNTHSSKVFLSVLDKKIANITQAPNSMSLQQPYVDVGLVLSDLEKEALKARNGALHGHKNGNASSVTELDRDAETFDHLRMLITKFVLQLCEYDGPYIDYASRPPLATSPSHDYRRLSPEFG
jgi:hypothetical protein